MHRIIFLLVLVFILFAGCDKETELDMWSSPITGSAVSFYSLLAGGNMTLAELKQIYGEDFFFTEHTLSSENIKVSLINIADTVAQATTDTNGRYVIEDVLPGTYNLTFSKPGFGTWKLFGVKHLGEDTTYVENVRMLEKSFCAISEIKTIDHDLSDNIITIEYELDCYIQNNMFLTTLIFGANQDLDINNYDSKRIAVDFYQFGEKTNVYFTDIDINEFYNEGYTEGQTIYLKGFFKNRYDFGYFDYQTGSTIFPTLAGQGTDRISFVLPRRY